MAVIGDGASISFSSPQVERVEIPGFAAPGFRWSAYIMHRPEYPASFWERIYTYHSQSSNKWEVAHDVGAGAGIASEKLATRFRHVIVSDPNIGYVDIASARISQFGYPQNKFAFLQETAENSSVPSSQVDLLTICEAFHWTDVPRAMSSFARQLKPGGTLSVNFYGMPQILGNKRAQRVWDELIDIWAHKLCKAGGVLARGVEYMSIGLDSVPLLTRDFEGGAKRITVDTGCRMRTLSPAVRKAPCRVGKADVAEIVDNDNEWRSIRNVQWLKGFYATLLPPVFEEEIQDIWKALEDVVEGREFEISWPLEQILATKRWDGAVSRL